MKLKVTFLLTTLTTLAIVHYLALTFFIYWKYPWFDIPVHLLGGFSAALGYGVFLSFMKELSPKWDSILWFLAAVLCVGIAWELFEAVSGVSDIFDEDFVSDTIIDLIMDCIGGLMGYTMIKHIIRIES